MIFLVITFMEKKSWFWVCSHGVQMGSAGEVARAGSLGLGLVRDGQTHAEILGACWEGCVGPWCKQGHSSAEVLLNY